MSKQRFSIAFDFEANMSSIVSSVANLKKELSGVNLPSNFTANFEKLFGKLESEMSSFQAMTKNGFNNMADVKKAEASFSKISKLFNQISLESSKVKGLDPNKLLPKELQTRTTDLKKKLSELQNQQSKKDDYAKKIEKQSEAIKKQQKELQNLEIARKALEDDAKSLGGQKGAATKRRNEAQSNLDAATLKRDKLITEGAKTSNPALQAAKKDIDTYAKAVRDAQAQIDTLSNKLNTNATAMRTNSASTEIAERELADLKAQLTQMQNVQVDPQVLTALREELAKIQGVGIDQISTDLQEIDTIIDGLDAKELEEIVQKMQKINTVTNQTDEAFEQAKQGVRDFTNTADGLDRAAQDMQNLQRQVQDFFSVTNSIQLFKRAVTSALNTVKELDATMTEAAVVTEFDIGDMWEKLPEYSANAQKLGVSINGMYQATTLYYQQGLKTNEAMQVGIETMKMAKIAGMDSAQATEAMTAALRGFNMELNETSAARVNDVYSQLAAVTAADTEQIATAMEKTASIAASANMKFETTAALLAQIIETTQEAPETAGTAMKTIIARFAEVKKLRDQGQMAGTDSEGEAIDVNKIQTALRTVGISMDGFFAGTEGLDQVLLKLANKWGTLDFETQRYIATMAAGSRQQSRFIAMMSDYGRTTELVGEAQNSAGASQRQFEKTQDSLEVKLQKLKNAWDQFLMGLSNNEVIKLAVDALTKILEGINGIIDGISGGNGLMKTITSLVGVIGALKLGQGIFGGKALGGISGFLGKMTGQVGAFKETIAESQGPDGSPVRIITREPYKEGEEAGAQAGQGFWNGFKRMVSSEAKGKRLESMFTTGTAQTADKEFNPWGLNDKLKQRKNNKIDKKYKKQANKELQDMAKKDANVYKAALIQRNADSGWKVEDLSKINQIYDDAIAKGLSAEQAAAAANEEYQKMGGVLTTTAQQSQAASEKTQALTLNMNALSGAAIGVGSILGVFASLLQNAGLEEEAELVSTLASSFMVLGTVMTTLSSIAPMLGMSFTTAGVQIGKAGQVAQAGWGWIGLILAIVAAVVAAGVAIAKSISENSPEKKLERLQEATEEAKEAANSAKDAYDGLSSSYENMQKMSDNLNSLTKGTLEWRRALIEANGEVLELLNTYPELSQYINRNADGQLEITQEGWDKILDKQMRAVENTQALAAQLELDGNKISKDLLMKDTSKQLWKAGVDSQDASTVIDEYMRTGTISGDYANKDEILQILGEYELKNREFDAQSQAYTQTMLSNFLTDTSRNFTYADEVLQGVSQKSINQSLATQTGSNYGVDSNNFKELTKEYGVSAEVAALSDTEDKLKELYKAMTGLTDDAIKDMKANEIQANIARMAEAKKSGNFVNELIQNMQGLDPADQKKMAAILSNDWRNLTLDALSDLNLDDLIKKTGMNKEDVLKGLGYEDAQFQNLSEEKKRNLAAKHAYSTEGLDDLSESEQLNKIEELFNITEYGAGLSKEEITQLEKEILERLKSGTLTSEDLSYFTGIDSTHQFTAEEIYEADQYVQQQEAKKRRQAYASRLKKYRDDLGSKFDSYSLGDVEGVLGQMDKLAKKDAIAYADAFLEVMNNTDLSEDKKSMLSSTLSSTDWSSMTSALDAYEQMQSLGLPTADIEEFWNTATDGANTYITTLSEVLQLTTRFQNKIASFDAMEGKLKNGTASMEDVLTLINSGAATMDDFKLGAEGWSMNPDKIAGAMKGARQATGQQASDAVARQKEEAEENRNVAEARGIVKNEDKTFGIRDQALYLGSDKKVSDYFGTNEETGKLYAKSGVTEDNKIDWAKFLGLDEESTIEEIQAELNNFINGLNNEEEIIFAAEHMAAYTKAAGYSTDEQQARQLAGKATEQDIIYSAQNEAMRLGLDGTELELFAQQLGGTAEAYEQAISNMKMNSGLGEIIESYDTWGALIDENSGLIKATTADDVKAFNDLKKATNKMLNTSEDLSDKFWNNAENMKNLEKAAKGDKEALEALQKAASADYLKNMNLASQVADVEGATNAINEFTNFMNTVDIPQLEAGVIWDDSGAQTFINRFNDMVRASNMSAEQIQEAVKAMGFDAEIIEVEDTRTVPKEYTERVVDETDEFGMKKWHTETHTEYDVVTGTFPIVKTLTSNGSGGGGVSTKNVAASNKGSGGGGSSKYKNSHDKSYNAYEKINVLLREREKLEKRYQKLIDGRAKSAKELVEQSQKEIENLQAQAELQKQVQDNKLKEINSLMSRNSKFDKYVTGFDRETGAIQIDWNEINKITDSEKGQEFDEYLSKLEELRDQWIEAQDSLDDINDQVDEINQRGKEEFQNFQERIKSAIIEERQQEIDKLSEINDSINDTNSRLLDAMQTQIDEYRQNRDNQKKQEEIEDKQRRLAYLQQDTSGANALEIMKLQEEIEQSQEDYTDTLIDQKISELQKQNDEAAEQRQRQIDIMQSQLDQYVKSREIWTEVKRLWDEAKNSDGSLRMDSELVQLLQKIEGYYELSEFGQGQWKEELRKDNNVAGLLAQKGVKPPSGQMIDFMDPNRKFYIHGYSHGDGKVEYGGKMFDVYMSESGYYVTDDWGVEIPQEPEAPPSSAAGNLASLPGSVSLNTEQIKNLQLGINNLIADGLLTETPLSVDGVYGPKTTAAVKKLQEKLSVTADGTWGPKTQSAFAESELKAYKTGGLADFTGPAWLDGTKSRPEYILNADQTRAFFRLVDILDGLHFGMIKPSQNNGDNIYDIDINVESIGSDYDVEQLAGTIKRLINEDARYRNNNAINLMR